MQRIAKLQKNFFSTTNPCDGLLISKPENILYLSGFSGSYGRLLITQKKAVLISDSRYSEKAKKVLRISPSPSSKKREVSPLFKGESGGISYLEITKEKDFWKGLAEKLHITTLGFEAHEVRVAHLTKLKHAFGKNIHLKNTLGIIEKLRAQKFPEEIAITKKTAEIADNTLAAALPYLHETITEKEFAWVIESTAREQFGAEAMSFDTIVAFGSNSAIPHHETSTEKLKNNTPILIDFGVKYKNYCSDMTRCFFFGTPTNEWKKAFQLVSKAQQAGIKAIKPGSLFSAPDTAARKVFGDQEKYFGHSFGHGVGLEIHESPALAQKSKGKFEENMIVTAEPGLYFPGKFGIRIEDLLVVKKGENEILSTFPKEYLL